MWSRQFRAASEEKSKLQELRLGAWVGTNRDVLIGRLDSLHAEMSRNTRRDGALPSRRIADLLGITTVFRYVRY